MKQEHVTSNCVCNGKYCSSCKKIKCIDQFCKNRAHKDGRNNYCKLCAKNSNEKNPDALRAYQKSYRAAYMQQNREAERLRANVKNANTKARKYHAEGTFTIQQWIELRERYFYTCLRCGKQEPDTILTVDHIIPLSMGGTNYIENIQPLCKSCNTAKFQASTDYRQITEKAK